MALRILFLSAVLLLAGASSTAQIPDEFTKLEIFPRDIGKRELIGAMKEFSSALGVRCHHCHEMKTPGDFDSIDWASEALPAKDKARGMMRLVGQLNSDLVPRAVGGPAHKVQCVTCHRGLTDPRSIDLVLLETMDKDGNRAGLEHYKELRAEFYGSGSYDFGPMVVLDMATTLAQNRGDTATAMEFLELNVKHHPDHAYSYMMMAQIQILSGDKEGAIANTERALAIEPENQQAQIMLQQLTQKAPGE
jgi:hypothetical protein